MLIGISPLLSPELLSILSVWCMEMKLSLRTRTFHMMLPSTGDTLNPAVENAYSKEVAKHWPDTSPIVTIDRFAFYERARKAFAVVMTGETRTSANIILKKGVTPIQY